MTTAYDLTGVALSTIKQNFNDIDRLQLMTCMSVPLPPSLPMHISYACRSLCHSSYTHITQTGTCRSIVVTSIPYTPADDGEPNMDPRVCMALASTALQAMGAGAEANSKLLVGAELGEQFGACKGIYIIHM